MYNFYITTLILTLNYLTILISNLQCAPYKWTMHVRMKHPGSHLCLHAFICDSFSREPCSISDNTYNIAFNIDICALWPEFSNFVEKSWGIFRVSVQGVKSIGGHFACLCRGFEFYEVKKKRYYFSKRKWKYFYTFNYFYSKKSSKRAK